MNVLIVDDEALARQRLRQLLHALPDWPCRIAEAASAHQAQQWLERQQGADAIDLLLLDIRMPGLDGVRLAQRLRSLPNAPVVVFVTAHADFALQAFEVQAADYLTKPVRPERLRQALERVQRLRQLSAAVERAGTGASWPPVADADTPCIVVHGRTGSERVPVSHILYCCAEDKYVRLHTATRDHWYGGSLQALETRFASRFLRVHRSVLVARPALRALERQPGRIAPPQWQVLLHGSDCRLPVARRLLPAVRQALRESGPSADGTGSDK